MEIYWPFTRFILDKIKNIMIEYMNFLCKQSTQMDDRCTSIDGKDILKIASVVNSSVWMMEKFKAFNVEKQSNIFPRLQNI